MGRPRAPNSGTSTARTVPSKRRAEALGSTKHDSKRVKTKQPQAHRPQAALNAAPTARLKVYSFGIGSAGELGLGQSSFCTYRPVQNHALDGAIAITTGGMHAAAISHDNKIFTWGCNDELALGRDTTFDMETRSQDGSIADSDSEDPRLNPLESTPTSIPGSRFPANARFVQLAAADSATFALTKDGEVYGWGTFRDDDGSHSFSIDEEGDLIKMQREPQLIPNLKNITQISAAGSYALALDSAGTVYSWGCSGQYQLGRRSLSRNRSLPIQPKPVALPQRKIASISACSRHAFAIDKSGNVWAWGLNNWGQTGISEHGGKIAPIIFPPRKVVSQGIQKIKHIDGGNFHSVAITFSGECLAWGKVHDGRTGADVKNMSVDDPGIVFEYNRPSILLRPTPLRIPNCVFAATGSHHSVAITSSGEAYSWGFNSSGQCGLGPDDTDLEPKDEILAPRLISSDAVRGKHICWAGAGGQFAILASEEASKGLVPPVNSDNN